MFESFLDPVLSPLLKMHPFFTILILSLLLSVLISYIYKWATDQNKMKALKAEIKKGQQKMKKHRDEPEKMMKIQKKVMEANKDYMLMSMKPTLFTFIPVILILGWLNGHMAFLPLEPGQPFNMTVEVQEGYNGEIQLKNLDSQIELLSAQAVTVDNGKVSFRMKAPQGLYAVDIGAGGTVHTKEFLVTNTKDYMKPEARFSEGPIKIIRLEHEKLKPLQDIPLINQIPWVKNFGWLGTYIILSIIFSISIRKALDIS